MFTADPRGLLGLVAVLMCWALAVVLFRVGTPDSVARKLALLLVIEGVALGTSPSLGFLLTSAEDTYRLYPWLPTANHIVHHLGDAGMLALYPPFLATALFTNLTRVFADKRVRFGIAGTAVVIVLIALSTPVPIGHPLLYLALILTFGFALVASIQAWHVATGAARTRALAFALAFGFRDLLLAFIYAAALLEIWSIPFALDIDSVLPRAYIYPIGIMISVSLISYGILRTQLFDIDLRIRWTIKQSTLAAAVVSIMFIISEGADRFLSAELGDNVGLFAAALVVFFLAPLQRFAERVATVAMPNTENTTEYTTFRKMQVYEAAVTEALQEGGISQKERSLLVRLRDSLGVSESDAQAIEDELHDPLGAIA